MKNTMKLSVFASVLSCIFLSTSCADEDVIERVYDAEIDNDVELETYPVCGLDECWHPPPAPPYNPPPPPVPCSPPYCP